MIILNYIASLNQPSLQMEFEAQNSTVSLISPRRIVSSIELDDLSLKQINVLSI